MRDTEYLVRTGKIPELLSDDHAYAAANPLVDLIKDQGRNLVGAGKHIFQTKHET